MKILHVSDVHIRLNQRHDEYKKVIDDLAEIAKAKRVDRIAVLGDTVHSKVSMSPELVSLLEYFLEQLAKVAPVDIILGNHDMNMSNKDRLDAISPITDMMNRGVRTDLHPITLMRDTGFHEVPDTDIIYGVWSVWDGKRLELKTEDKISGKTYIAMFHGPVHGSQLDNNYTIIEASVPANIFDNFDIVLLGDIHKYQDIRKDRTAAYAGALIQQNFGESIDKGVLLWETDTRSYERIIVPNDYCFYTLYAEDDSLPDLELPSKCRMRVVWPINENDISRAEVNRLTQLIRDKYNPLSVRIDFKPRKSDKMSFDVNDGFDINDINVQQELLKRWLLVNYASEDEIEHLLDLDRKIFDHVNTLHYEDFAGTKWKMNSVELENFMSYVGPELVDFRRMKGVIGLFGDNKVGKSVLIDAVLYALFNKTTRGVKNDDLINKNTKAKSCKVTLELTIKGIDYKIERKTRRLYKKRSGAYDWTRTDLVVSKRLAGDNTWEDMTETQRSETEKVIRNAIGSYEDFLTTTLSTQETTREFVNQGSADRAQNLIRFLGLNILSSKFDYARDKKKELEILNSRIVMDDELQRQAALFEEQNELKFEIEEHETEIAEVEIKIDSTKVTVENLNQRLNLNVTMTESKEDITIELEDAKQRQDELKVKKTEIEKSLKRLNATIVILEADQLSPELRSILEKRAHAIVELEKMFDEETRSRKHAHDQMTATLEEVQNMQPCPVADIPEASGCAFLQLANTKRTAVANFKAKFDAYTETIELIREKLLKLGDPQPELDDDSEIIHRLETHGFKLITTRHEMSEIDSKIEASDMSIKLLLGKLRMIGDHEETIKQNKSIRESVDGNKQFLASLARQLDRTREFSASKGQRLAIVSHELESITKTIEEHEENLENIYLYALYCSAMHRNGIPLTVMKRFVPLINYEINAVLGNLVDFGVYFVIDDESHNIEIVMRDDGKEDTTRPVTMASGMEKLLTNLTIRYVLIKLSNISKSSTYWIDEGFGVLDPDNVYLIQKFFEQVKQTFDNIVMITHIDTMKDAADTIITVVKKSGNSKLVLS